MENDGLQVENGNFTRIVNPLIEHLIKVPFKGCELAVAMLIIRKTYGYHKTQDSISLSQFCAELNRARSTVNLALKTLQLVGIVKLVRRGDLKGASNIWKINKYFNTWNLVRLPKLVRQKRTPSMTKGPNLVRPVIHTKETKESYAQKKLATKVARKGKETKYNPLGSEIIRAFEVIDPKNKTYYGNTTQRAACDFLLEEYGLEEVKKRIEFLPQSNKMPYFPAINSPNDLKEKWTRLQDKVEQYKLEKSKGKGKIFV